MEVGDKLAHAKAALVKATFAESAAIASEVIALIRAHRVTTPNAFETELKVATVILSISDMNLGAFDCAADGFLSLKIDHADLLTDTKWTANGIAVLAVLAVIASPASSRTVMITTLTDSVKSCVRDHFDDDPFPLVLELGTCMKACKFTLAIERLENILKSPQVMKVLEQRVSRQIMSSFIDVCLIQLLGCYEKVDLSTLAQELRISEDALIQRLEKLILDENLRLAKYRIDLQQRFVHSSDAVVTSETAFAYLQEALGNMELLSFRQCLAEANIRIEN